jgi:hypothetical protein
MILHCGPEYIVMLDIKIKSVSDIVKEREKFVYQVLTKDQGLFWITCSGLLKVEEYSCMSLNGV